MKNILRTAMAVMAIAVVGVFAATALPVDKYTISRSELPQNAQEFLTKHFPKAKVSMIKVDRHLLRSADYDVKLTNGTKIEFNTKGEWTSVDCKNKAVPSALIIKNIQKYLDKNFAGQTVVKIEKDLTAYELELNNGVELNFDRLGNFKKAKFDD